MHIKPIMQASLLCSFSFVQCMELTEVNSGASIPITLDQKTLEKIVKNARYSSQEITGFLSERIQNRPLTTQNIPSVLKLDKIKIDEIFINNVKDDHIRDLMLSLGADINTQTSGNNNCLWGITKPTLLNELINKGANVNHVNKSGETPLMALKDCKPHKIPMAAQTLLSHGVPPDSISNNKNVLLYVISKTIKTETGLDAINLLLKYKVDINGKVGSPNWYTTLLIEAIVWQNTKLVQFLLEHGADPNIPDHDGNYPIHCAIGSPYQYHHMHRPAIPEIVSALVKHGSKTNIHYPKWAVSPFQSAKQYNEQAIMKILEGKNQTIMNKSPENEKLSTSRSRLSI